VTALAWDKGGAARIERASVRYHIAWINPYKERVMSAAVTSKGQVTIPKPVRDLLGIEPGTLVDFQGNAEGGLDAPSRFAKLRGHAGKGLSTDGIMVPTRSGT
jgi:antitoxin PrlF